MMALHQLEFPMASEEHIDVTSASTNSTGPRRNRPHRPSGLPNGNLYLRMRDELGSIDDDGLFVALFPDRGQPADAPWRLALVTVLQFVEGLSDRQAADAVRSLSDWKYALSLELPDSGFDFSILREFRTRLITGAQESLLATRGHAHATQGARGVQGPRVAAYRSDARAGGDPHT
jgi:Transposase domain (DUF772)